LDSKNWDKRKLKPKESLLSLEAVVSARDAKEWQAEPQPPRPFAPSGIRFPENGFSGSGTRRGREPTNAWLCACLVIVVVALRLEKLG